MDVPDNGPRIKVALWIITVFPAIFGALRLYCKGRFKSIVGWDDAVLIFSWVLLLVYTIVIHVSIDMGIGRHLVDIPPANIVPALRLVYVGEFVIIIGCSLSKTSFAITLLRAVTQTWQKVLVWWIIISMNTIMFLCAILYFAQCNPVDRLWDFSITEGSCWDISIMTRFAMAAGAYSAAMDFILAFLPWTFLLSLQMKKREKFGIAIAMSLGVFAGATAIVKTTYLPNISLIQDFTYFSADVLIWAGVETGVTLIAASIPFLRPLVRVVSGYGRSNKYGRSDPNSSTSNSKAGGNSAAGQHSRKRSSMLNRKPSKGFNKVEEDDVEMNKWGATAASSETATNKSFAAVSVESATPLSGGIKQTNEITISYDQVSVSKSSQ